MQSTETDAQIASGSETPETLAADLVKLERSTISKFVRIFTEEESLKEGIKELADEAKDAGLNVAVLKAVAKAIVANKVDELIEKSEVTLKLVEISRS